VISDIEEFIKYFHSQRRRTQWVVDAFPPDKADWRPWPGDMSAAEIICHVAAGHWMYASVAAHDHWEIDDYEQSAETWERALRYFHHKTEAALDLLRPLPNGVLKQKRRRLDNNLPTSVWRFLMLMIEHEVHHRAQLESYLMLLNAQPPRMSGLSIAAVRLALTRQTPSVATAEDE
jgi:uncharacterized damage-inducible protein DinB